MKDGKLEIGDVVQLKSGGPKMTLNRKSDDPLVLCVWFRNNHEDANSMWFSEDALELVGQATHPVVDHTSFKRWEVVYDSAYKDQPRLTPDVSSFLC